MSIKKRISHINSFMKEPIETQFNVLKNLIEKSKKLTVGEPYVNDITVSATVLKHGRDRKVIIFKKKRRKGYRRKNGHRQSFSLVQIDSISNYRSRLYMIESLIMRHISR